MKKLAIFFSNIFAFIKISLAKLINQIAIPAVELTIQIEKWLNSDVLDIGAALTATPLDEKILAALRKAFPKIIEYLKITTALDECFTGDGTPEQMMQCIIEHLRATPAELRNDALKHIASEVGMAMSENDKLTRGKMNFAVEGALLKIKNADTSDEVEEDFEA